MNTPTIKLTSKDRFWLLLNQYPRLDPYWDRSGDGSVDLDSIAKTPLSRQERVLADILVSIWLGYGADNKIDFTDLGTLDSTARQPLIDWIQKPFWP